MKIIKAPEFEVIVCECGVVFQPECTDAFEYRLEVQYPHRRVLCIRCPYCRARHEASRAENKKEEG
jgi:hypothetical protein